MFSSSPKLRQRLDILSAAVLVLSMVFGNLVPVVAKAITLKDLSKAQAGVNNKMLKGRVLGLTTVDLRATDVSKANFSGGFNATPVSLGTNGDWIYTFTWGRAIANRNGFIYVSQLNPTDNLYHIVAQFTNLTSSGTVTSDPVFAPNQTYRLTYYSLPYGSFTSNYILLRSTFTAPDASAAGASGTGACEYAAPPLGCSWQGGSAYPACGAKLVCSNNNSTTTSNSQAPVFSPWNSAAIGSGNIAAMAEYNGNLIVAGQFTSIGGVAANDIAQWNGTSWSALGKGVGSLVSGSVNALAGGILSLAVYNGNLVAGGYFTNAGGIAVNNISQWNGTSWSALGSGVNVQIISMVVYNNNLIAAGLLSTAGGIAVNNIAQWNGTSWSSTGLGSINGNVPHSISALTVYNNNLIAAAYFLNATGPASSSNILQWDGTSWSAMAAQAIITVPQSLAIGQVGTFGSFALYNGNLVAAGRFDAIGNVVAGNIAQWDGTSWSALGSGLNYPGQPYKVAVYNGNLFAVGSFWTDGTFSRTNIMELEGTTWTPVGSVVAQPNCLLVYNGSLYIGAHSGIYKGQ
ncbi:MAG: hypothetical protein P4L74_02255 [Candidatus Doudnabacteria bacterium]|nr:hypothetical protein [Candidatus Doudnabacteria bacterium]